jgi:SPP1 family predicted phage head-tail adaptor
MRAGALDRWVDLQKETVTQNDFGEEVKTWASIGTVSAGVEHKPGSEAFQAQQIVGRAVMTLRVRYRRDVTVMNRVVLVGKDWGALEDKECDIHDVREIGRKEGLWLDVSARSEP